MSSSVRAHRGSSRLPAALFVAGMSLLASSLGAREAGAQEPPGATAAPSLDASGAPRLVIPEAARARPGFDVDRATEAYIALIPPAARERSDAYFEGEYVLLFVGAFWTVGAALLVLGGGRAARLRDAVRARVQHRLPGDFLIAGTLLVAAALLELPYSIWVGYFREHAYGMSNETLGGWFADWGKGLAIGTLMGAVFIALLYAIVRRAPRTWWIWGAGATTLFATFAVAISPVFIAPLFNKYEKLEAGALRDEVLSMARAHRIPADDVFWFDASKQTKRISANVSGFGNTMRISLNDNLLRRSPRETVVAVLGHEMGHYVLNHVAEMLVTLTLVIVAAFAFVHFAFAGVARRFPAWRLEGIADVAGLPLASALLTAFMTVAAPIDNSIVRTNEAEADAFGIASSRQPDGFAFAAVQLSEYRKMKPGRLEEIVFYDHPSGYDRIHRAMAWKAEHLDEMMAREAAAEGSGATPGS